MTAKYQSNTRNQLANVTNPYQSDSTKALCVCSAGLLRSPTIAKFLSEKGYNTRACGTSMDYALIPISHALVEWADEIHVVSEQLSEVQSILKQLDLSREVFEYNIPDKYNAFSIELIELITEEFNKVI